MNGKYTTPFANVQETAERYRVSVKTIFNWRKNGFPAFKVNGRVIVDIEKADEWVRNHT